MVAYLHADKSGGLFGRVSREMIDELFIKLEIETACPISPQSNTKRPEKMVRKQSEY